MIDHKKNLRSRIVSCVDRRLCKTWMLALEDAKDGALAWFDSGYVHARRFQDIENEAKEQHELLTWGIVVGRHGSEEAALKAVEREEVSTSGMDMSMWISPHVHVYAT